MMRSTKHNHHDPFRVQASACSLPHRYFEILQGFRAFRGFRGVVFLLAVFVALWISSAAAQAPEEQSTAIARKQKVADLLSSAQGPATDRAPRIAKENGGYVRHVGFPRGRGIEAPGADPRNPRDVTEKFLGQWWDAFVNPSAKVHFETTMANTHRGRSYVRVQQKYGGLKVFDAQMNIQVGADGRVQSVLCNVMRDTGVLDRGELSTSPTLTADAAREAAIQLFSDIVATATLQAFTASPPDLLLFHPPVVGRKGPTRLVWNTVVQHLQGPLVEERVLVDAHTGEVPLHFSLTKDIRDRMIYDKDGDGSYDLGTLEREEDDEDDTGIDPVDLAFLFYFDIYGQNWTWHSLDSYDNASHPIAVSVRWGVENAGWVPSLEHIFVGTKFLFDDCAMHEYTHGVSDLLMQLEYLDESAALHESFSDMWGEWYDQEINYVRPDYGYENCDDAAVTWLVNEDYFEVYEGTLPVDWVERNMKDPPSPPFYHPDRYKGPNWSDATEASHSSNGVGNKLCYLLTDGVEDPFNGFTILPTGPSSPDTARREAAAELFYAARSGLVSSAKYYDLYTELLDAADALSYSDAQKLNVKKACQSVNIRNHEDTGLTLKDTNGAKVALLQDSGQLLLKGGLIHYPETQSPITPSGVGLILKNDAGTVVAFINATAENGGEMTILGTLTQNDLPSAASKLLVVRYEGVPVAALDASGNLSIWREADDNDADVQED
jgi:Zn-dependent metalloprotease